ncbi:MAG: methyltransferase, partial [Kiritimatiellaeota bacterium]|nr:methyltransferase [Kiritimatiellota bacterium]
PKQRVLAALSHREPDRVPRFIWLGGEVKKRLCEKHGVPPLDLDLKIGNDILQTWVSINGEMERDAPQGAEFTDAFGITWRRDGAYNMVVKHPLRGFDADQLRAYQPPDPRAPERFAHLEFLLRNYGRGHFIGADVSSTLFDPACHLRHMEDFMMDLASGGEEAEILLDKLAEFAIALSRECVARGADWIWLGDDLGSQKGMLMSPEMWRQWFKPRMKKIIAAIRDARPGIPVAYHSCGSMAPVIPDLVEIGVDVLNPLQESAAGMDHDAVKREFGGRLALMCGLDTQQFMPRATPAEIAAKTKDTLARLAPGGGYIFAVSHTIQGDVSDAQIDAMLGALG